MKTLERRRTAHNITTVIIGGGQAGLATSACLTGHGIDHIVLERGEVANSWRTERWDSLRLLTPNWQLRLPGMAYNGADPDGFMPMKKVIRFLGEYARHTAVPLQVQTRVSAVFQTDTGYRVETDRGTWRCQTLVIASGAFNVPTIPPIRQALPDSIDSLTAHQYRRPGQLADGGVLVVGAAATGVQIADELQRSGRQVTLSVGEHVRVPRSYRGRDIEYWMQLTGLLDETHEQVDDLQRARRLPSPQLTGTREKRSLDLNALSSIGVKLVGRLAGMRGRTAQFSGSLAHVTKMADLKQQRLLNVIEQWLATQGEPGGIQAAETPEPTRIDPSPCLAMDLSGGAIKTVIWATGFRPDYSWLHVPVVDRKGQLIHCGGVTGAPGLYAMGLPFMRRRKSHSIFGAENDARDISTHLVRFVKGGHRGRRRSTNENFAQPGYPARATSSQCWRYSPAPTA